MSKRKYAKDPLLYIHQASISTPKAPMQEHYVSRRKKESPKNEEELNEEKNDTVFHSRKKEESVAQQSGTVKERIQFKDMTIQERVEHFLNMSPYAPKMKCEVKTDKRSFRGLIMDFKDNLVFVQSGKRMNQIALEEIKDIRLIGF